MQTEHSPFPSDETLAAYIDGRLDEETRQRVVEHMAECPECFDAVILARESSSLAPAGHISVGRPKAAVLFAAAAALVIIASISLLQFRKAHQPDAIAALDAVAPSQRYEQGRVNAVKYRPMRTNFRGRNTDADDPLDSDTWRVKGVAADIQTKVRENPTPDNLHALGVSYILTGDWKNAILTLESAVERETGEKDPAKASEKSNDPVLLNDLSVAYLAAARYPGEDARVSSALNCAEHSWSVKQTPEAAWNRALAYESLHFRDRARAAWHDYLNLDHASKWSLEAQDHLKKLDEPTQSSAWLRDGPTLQRAAQKRQTAIVAALVCAYPFESRTLIEDELFPAWARAASSGDTNVAAMIELETTAIGKALAECNGDTFARDAASFAFHFEAAARLKIAADRRRFDDAVAAYKNGNNIAAEAELNTLQVPMRTAGDPYVERVALMRATCAYFSNRYAESEAISSAILDDPHVSIQHRALRAHALWIRASSRIIRGHPLEAIADHEAALAEYAKLNEIKRVADVHARLASDYDIAGNPEVAWAHRIAALDGLDRLGALLDSAPLLLEAARLSMQRSEIYTARVLLDDQIALCNTPDWRDLRVRGLLARAELNDSLGAKSAANADRQEAMVLAPLIPSKDVRFFVTTSADFLRARFVDGVGLDDVAAIHEALEYSREHEHRARMADLLLAEARAYERRGDRVRARTDIDAAIAELDVQRSSIASSDGRAAFIESKRSVFAEAIGLSLSAGDAEHAFTLVERSRARSLADDLGASAAAEHGISTADVAHWLPGQVAVVEISVIPQHLLIWLIRHEGVRFYERPLRDGQLATAASVFVAKLRLSDALPGAGELYELAVAPWISDVGDARSIVIIADRELVDVPFAALSARPATPCLVERFSLISAPSATLLITGLSRGSSGSELSSVLVAAPGVGNDSDLDELKGAADEARRIAAMYRTATLLDGREATKARFVAAAATAMSVHFAGHAIANSKMPSLSALVMRDNEGRTTYLYAHEIATMNLRGTRLVVLSACATSAASAARSDGLSSLSRAFLASGVSSVIGSWWPIDDAAVEHLAVNLHERLRMGDPPAAALRAVQLQSLRHIPPRDWAAFALSGDLSSI